METTLSTAPHFAQSKWNKRPCCPSDIENILIIICLNFQILHATSAMKSRVQWKPVQTHAKREPGNQNLCDGGVKTQPTLIYRYQIEHLYRNDKGDNPCRTNRMRQRSNFAQETAETHRETRDQRQVKCIGAATPPHRSATRRPETETRTSPKWIVNEILLIR